MHREHRGKSDPCGCLRYGMAELLAHGRISNSTAHNALWREAPETCAGGGGASDCAHPGDIWSTQPMPMQPFLLHPTPPPPSL